MLERQIIIALIVSTEYCEKIKEIYNPRFLESSTAKLIASWVWEYYHKYKKAPGKAIETVFFSKVKSAKISKSTAEEIEKEILPDLSEQYTNQEFDLRYILEETEKYFNAQNIKIYTSASEKLVSEGKIEEAEKLMRDFKPIGLSHNKIADFVCTASQIRKKDIPFPTEFFKDWLRAGEITIIYGNWGVGKSLLVMVISYLLGMRKEDSKKIDIGEWVIKNPTGTLYVDGELGEKEMQERVSKYEWLGWQKYSIKIFSLPEYQFQTQDVFSLSQRQNQLKLITWLKDNPDYKLIILDSVSTLFGLENENDNSEWSNKVNPFLRDLRALGVATILLHHTGKDHKRGFRGASAIGAMAMNIFKLIDHGDKEAGEAWFVLSKDKQRAGGKIFNDFSMHFSLENSKTETHWEILPK